MGRAAIGGFQPNRIAGLPLGQLALQGGAQVLDFFFVDLQVGVAGNAELIAADHMHAVEQFVDVGMQDGRRNTKPYSTPEISLGR